MSSKKKNNKKWFGFLVACLLLVIVVIAILFFTGKIATKKGYIISYHNNGHGQMIEEVNDVKQLPNELPVLTENGFTFDGWFYDVGFEKKAYPKDEIKKNTNLYAKWTKEISQVLYTVSFQPNNGSPIEKIQIEEGKPIPRPTDPNKTSFVFGGWYSDSNFKNLWDFSSGIVTMDMTLYAKWDKSQIVIKDELAIHFLELGNSYAGDSVYIKAGDVDILIDAGSRASSSTTIHNYIKKYCTDGILEYVIATHAHQDHIAGFVGTSSNPGIFDLYECEVIIDYALKNTTSTISKNYEEARNKEVVLGAKHYTARDCIEKTNGASSVYQITDEIQLEMLKQKFYYEKASDENDYSVCMMLHYKDSHFLFTGDLEHEGEESLVSLNNLPHCKVFKGGHHGSKTSSNEILLAKITPEIVCVCCCAGSSEYTDNVDNMFPTQDFITRVAKYTDQIYVTTLAKYTIAKNKEGKEYPKVTGFTSMNGNIVVTLNSLQEIVVQCSNNNTILKDTEWFQSELILNGVSRKMRIWPTP